MAKSPKSIFDQTPPWLKAPQPLAVVTINGRKYFNDTRLKEFRDVTNPHNRIPYDVMDAAPEAFAFGDLVPVPFKVDYRLDDDGRLALGFTPALDGRPFFRDLPFTVRCAARLHYLLTWHQHVRKLDACADVVEREAAMNDILYKAALTVALDPDIAAHKPFIVDVNDDLDDFRRWTEQGFSQEAAMASVPGEPEYKLNRAIVHVEDAKGAIKSHVIVSPEGVRTFSNYPLAVRIEARVRFFMSEGTPFENNLLTHAHDLPAKEQQMIWDEILCARADKIMARNRELDEQDTIRSQRR